MPAISLPMRILLVKTSSLGDVVHNLPVASDIAAALPGVKIDWMVEEAFADIPRLHPAVGRIIPVAVRRWRKQPFSRIVRGEFSSFKSTLSEVNYDLVLDSQGLLKSALLARLAILTANGVRFGLDRISVREPFATVFYDRTATVSRNLHAVERNRQLGANALGYLPSPSVNYGIQAEGLVADWLPPDPFTVLLSATSRDDKLWPESHWIALGTELAGQGSGLVLPWGSVTEQARAHRIAAAIPGAVVAPALGIASLAQLFARANRVIGLDTGLTHLAAALDKPTTAIFTGSDPALTGVFAGSRAINLGGSGLCPTVAEVLASF